MESYSKLDEEVFKEFMNDKERLHSIANEIRKISMDEKLKAKIYKIEDDEETFNDSVMEGQVLYKLHKVRERNNEIVLLKKKQAIDLVGFLSCEACIFDFEKFYGVVGKGYIECHHRTPLSKFKAEAITRLDDLALVCSNCHRILHRSTNALSVEDLKTQIQCSYKFG
jgi:5-methylcytosine-specific restriction protein A